MTHQLPAFQVTPSPDGHVVHLAGDLDEHHVPRLLEVLAPLEATGGTLDLSDLTFLPSRAVGELAVAQARAGRGGVVVRLVARPGTIAAAVLRATAVAHEPA